MLSIEELAVAKVKCLTDTLFFTRFFFKELNGKKFVIGDHHIKISKALDRVYSGQCKRLIINIAPRYGKTELAVKMAIAKGLAINHKSKYIHLSYSESLALDNSETIKEIVKLPIFQQMFPDVKIKKGTDAKQKWYTQGGGGIYATASGGQVTGFGAGLVEEEKVIEENNEFSDWVNDEQNTDLFGGAIIIDDPLKPEDARSELMLKKINERFDSTIQNRVNSRNTPIIVIMQRIDPNDLCGHLQKNYPGWEVLSLPVINDDGTALWPFKHTLQELEILKKSNSYIFNTQMMQDPRPQEGLLFQSLKRYFKKDLTDDGLEATVAYCDVKDEGDDYLACPFGKVYKSGKVFITDVVYSSDTVTTTVPQVAAKFNELKCNYIRVEKNNAGGGFIRDLRKLVPPEKVLSIHNTQNKLTRIWNEYAFITERCYFLDPSEYELNSEYDKFITNILGFLKDGTSKHDDGPDAMAGEAKFIQSFYPHLFK